MELMTTGEVAERFGVDRSTALRWAKRGLDAGAEDAGRPVPRAFPGCGGPTAAAERTRGGHPWQSVTSSEHWHAAWAQPAPAMPLGTRAGEAEAYRRQQLQETREDRKAREKELIELKRLTLEQQKQDRAGKLAVDQLKPFRATIGRIAERLARERGNTEAPRVSSRRTRTWRAPMTPRSAEGRASRPD